MTNETKQLKPAPVERRVRHMVSPVMAEYSLCGMAFDAYESGDAEDQIIFAQSGETITCIGCKKIIAEAKKVRHWKCA